MQQRKKQSPLVSHVQHSIKTGLACIIAYFLSLLLGSPFAIWAVVSTIIAMQGISVAESVQAGILRLSGMGLGAIVGVVLLVVAPPRPLELGVVIFFITAVGSYITRYGTRYMLASIGTCMVLLGGFSFLSQSGYLLTKIDPVMIRGAVKFGVLMVIEIALGVGVAFVVTFAIWPVRMVDTLRNDLKRQFRYCASIFGRLVDSFLNGQHQLSPNTLVGIGMIAGGNRGRLSKVVKNEAYIYKYEHNVMEVQILVIERAVDAMRNMLDALNEYDEKDYKIELDPELRTLGDFIVKTLLHLGGEEPKKPRPDLVRALTKSVAAVEEQLAASRENSLKELPIHRMMQLFTYCQTMRQLTEELLLALDILHQINATPPGRHKHIYSLRARGSSAKKVD